MSNIVAKFKPDFLKKDAEWMKEATNYRRLGKFI